jgi:hypothetical protein
MRIFDISRNFHKKPNDQREHKLAKCAKAAFPALVLIRFFTFWDLDDAFPSQPSGDFSFRQPSRSLRTFKNLSCSLNQLLDIERLP